MDALVQKSTIDERFLDIVEPTGRRGLGSRVSLTLRRHATIFLAPESRQTKSRSPTATNGSGARISSGVSIRRPR